MDQYDYIITGAGASGLSLLMHLIKSGKFADKQILLVDRSPKTNNDRTWCFWEQAPGLFEEIVYKRWTRMWFHDNDRSTLHDIAPYEYKLIRGIDFYSHCFDIIGSQKNVTVRYGDVQKCVSDRSGTYIMLDGEKIAASYIFNSILSSKPAVLASQHYLLQHFKGWIIETATPTFDAAEATLMDFRIPQVDGDTSFVYVMPFSDTRALVEFTVFSKSMLDDDAYERALRSYCTEFLHIDEYRILEEEFNAIPMTDFKFVKRINNLINIGTAGGQTKPSSGYTFSFIQKHSRAITEALIQTGQPFTRKKFADKRFHLYDHTLLSILDSRSFPGQQIFSTLMASNKMTAVFRFLDNETSLIDELRIIRKLPKRTFLKAALNL